MRKVTIYLRKEDWDSYSKASETSVKIHKIFKDHGCKLIKDLDTFFECTEKPPSVTFYFKDRDGLSEAIREIRENFEPEKIKAEEVPIIK